MALKNIKRIKQAKVDIKAAIEDKGVEVPDTALISDYDDYIAQIETGGGSEFTGHVDEEGLKAIGWTDDDIQVLKDNIWWDEDMDDCYKVNAKSKAAYSSYSYLRQKMFDSSISAYFGGANFCPRFPVKSTSSYEFKNCGNLFAMPDIKAIVGSNDYSAFAETGSNIRYIYMSEGSNWTNTSFINFGGNQLYTLHLKSLIGSATFAGTRDPYLKNAYVLKHVGKIKCTSSNVSLQFQNCYALEEIEEYDIPNVTAGYGTSNQGTYNTFSACYMLHRIYIKNLRTNINLSSATNLEIECVHYLLENAIGGSSTANITVVINGWTKSLWKASSYYGTPAEYDDDGNITTDATGDCKLMLDKYITIS